MPRICMETLSGESVLLNWVLCWWEAWNCQSLSIKIIQRKQIQKMENNGVACTWIKHSLKLLPGRNIKSQHTLSTTLHSLSTSGVTLEVMLRWSFHELGPCKTTVSRGPTLEGHVAQARNKPLLCEPLMYGAVCYCSTAKPFQSLWIKSEWELDNHLGAIPRHRRWAGTLP